MLGYNHDSNITRRLTKESEYDPNGSDNIGIEVPAKRTFSELIAKDNYYKADDL